MIDRRDFLKFVAGGAVGTLATPVIWQGLDDISIWSQNWPWIPHLEYGENVYVKTVSKICPSAVGMKVRLVGGRPVTVMGDPDHPLSLGGISSLAATEVQMRYSPARIKAPLKKGLDGSFVEISWGEAEILLKEVFLSLKKKNSFVCVSGDENGTMNELFSGFTRKLGSDKFFIMPSEIQPTAVAWDLMGGKGRVGYDFEKSDFVLAVGASVLESWGTVVSNRRAWGNARSLDCVKTMQFAYAGAVENNTASGADFWLPIKPGSELFFLLGIVRQLLLSGLKLPTVDFPQLYNLAMEWTPKKVSLLTGLRSFELDNIVKQLKKAKAPLVIVGSSLDQGGGAATVMVGIIINMLLKRINKKGGLCAVPVADPIISMALKYREMMHNDFVSYIESVASSKEESVEVFLFYEANPMYALPGGSKFKQVFKKAKYSIAFSSFLDETASTCDLVIPIALGLERFDDVAYPFGYGQAVYTITKPVAPPLYESRVAGDIILSLAKSLGFDFGFKCVEEIVKAKADQLGADWDSLMKGVAFVKTKTIPVKLSCRSDIIQRSLQLKPKENKLCLGFVHKLALGTPETAIPPFNTKTITVDELQNNILIARINSSTAKKYGLSNNMRVKIVNKTGVIPVQILVFEGVANNTIALTMGFGHTAFDIFNIGKGSNIMDIIPVRIEPGTGIAVWDLVMVDTLKV